MKYRNIFKGDKISWVMTGIFLITSVMMNYPYHSQVYSIISGLACLALIVVVCNASERVCARITYSMAVFVAFMLLLYTLGMAGDFETSLFNVRGIAIGDDSTLFILSQSCMTVTAIFAILIVIRAFQVCNKTNVRMYVAATSLLLYVAWCWVRLCTHGPSITHMHLQGILIANLLCYSRSVRIAPLTECKDSYN